MSWSIQAAGKAGEVQNQVASKLQSVSASIHEESLRNAVVALLEEALMYCHPETTVAISCSGEEMVRLPDKAHAVTLHIQLHSSLAFAPPPPAFGPVPTPEGKEIPQG